MQTSRAFEYQALYLALVIPYLLVVGIVPVISTPFKAG